jgi:hypothetical protein
VLACAGLRAVRPRRSPKASGCCAAGLRAR